MNTLKKNKKNKGNREEDKPDYLNLSRKEKWRSYGLFVLKWGTIILFLDAIFCILLYFFQFNPWAFFEWSMITIPGIILIIGGCMGGLSRYNPPPKIRINEPEDQTVIPANFQISVKYNPKFVQENSIEIFVNHKKVKSKKGKDNVHVVPKIFKSPPQNLIALSIKAEAKNHENKLMKDEIKVICDPDADEEDYQEYWEFKRDENTYWGKEMEKAKKTARKEIFSTKLMLLSLSLLLVNVIVTTIVGLQTNFYYSPSG